MSDIKDRDVRKALEQLADAADVLKIEYANKEQEAEEHYQDVLTKESTIESLNGEIDELNNEVEKLKLQILELEEALAEAYLTSRADGEQ